MKFKVFLLMCLMQAAYAQTGQIGRNYTLPASKVYLAACQNETQRRHFGDIVGIRLLYGQNLSMRYELDNHEGGEWLVLCDLATGKIIREQKMLVDGN